ncbi:MAG TPA: multicopper oxidase domain-containing protein [Thermoanaerobaculia bacterium]|jgi:FtsP/CotA-like multicopper oxidase with cupredoxin domain|nr:multicopper oxidase domain-containing protein [Thermoanaerobaculia bacterium]
MKMSISRRSLLQLAGLGSLATGVGALTGRPAATPEPAANAAMGHHAGHAMGAVGRVSTETFDPMSFLRAWNFSDLPEQERARFYRETPQPDGSLLREYELFAVDREIEIAPGIFFPAWTYNGQVPGPSLRATEGDRVRVNFVNQGSHPHTMHFHGWHSPDMDGSMPEHQVAPGERFVYEFDAEPFGLHLYHCHAVPLKRHIHKGLYGAFIVDPKTPRPPADEMVMIMNGFDTNFDADNEVYAVNSVAHFHMADPIAVSLGQVVRIYLVNLTEFDLINSFHLHGMFFQVNRTGTSLEGRELTDTLMLCQGERAILEMTFRYPGLFMFHAHQSEFAELGWMGLFKAGEGPLAT